MALLTARLAACDDFRSTQQNSAASAKVASANATPTAGNVIAEANAPPPQLAPPVTGNALAAANAPAANSFASDASAQVASVDVADLPAAAQSINQAAPASRAQRAVGYDPVLLRLEVLLDRAGFSPGAIDGRQGTNLKHALAAYAQAHGIQARGPQAQGSTAHRSANGNQVDPQLWNQITGADAGPVVQAYRITAEDEQGPFIGTPPKDYQALSKLPALAYSSPEQELAERFHMSPKLLQALNPKADFTQVGTLLVVAAPGAPHTYDAARIEVDKSNDEVRVFGADGKVAAVYPATVGSTERPAPSGEFAVAAVAPHPAYYYDPARLTFTPTGAKGKLRIAPGPNNPVGSTWIALTIPTYGIHGAPDPTEIGKQQSHGCVRLTNWDAAELGKAVKKGVPVDFVGTEAKPKRLRKA
ncbi:MAG TPA: L,D-transpeptidase [Caulobacteraceae bacterium]|nr:L,D-transpeptidase [Caulobacteraceae bacterium]